MTDLEAIATLQKIREDSAVNQANFLRATSMQQAINNELQSQNKRMNEDLNDLLKSI